MGSVRNFVGGVGAGLSLGGCPAGSAIALERDEIATSIQGRGEAVCFKVWDCCKFG
jgi:hypothetical protein